MTIVDDMVYVQQESGSCTLEMNFIGDDKRNIMTATFSNPFWDFLVVKQFRVSADMKTVVGLLEEARIIHPGHPYIDDDDEDEFEEEEDDE